MTSIWVESLGRSFEESLTLLQAAVEGGPDDLWEGSMWTVDPGQPDAYSAPWLRAWHALEVIDYDLAGEFEPWKPPPPFDKSFTGDTSRVWTRDEILGYLECCRQPVRRTAHTAEHAMQIQQFVNDARR